MWHLVFGLFVKYFSPACNACNFSFHIFGMYIPYQVMEIYLRSGDLNIDLDLVQRN
jgi:hypothetical protein